MSKRRTRHESAETPEDRPDERPIERPAARRGAPRWEGRPGCSILAGMRQVVNLSHKLQRSLHRLNQDVRRCARCPNRDECPAVLEYIGQVNAAIQEVNEEWDRG